MSPDPSPPPSQNGGSVIFPPVVAGQTAAVRFVISNTGTSPTAVNSVGVLATGSTFSTSNVPSLPVSLAPGASLAFDVNSRP